MGTPPGRGGGRKNAPPPSRGGSRKRGFLGVLGGVKKGPFFVFFTKKSAFFPRQKPPKTRKTGFPHLRLGIPPQGSQITTKRGGGILRNRSILRGAKTPPFSPFFPHPPENGGVGGKGGNGGFFPLPTRHAGGSPPKFGFWGVLNQQQPPSADLYYLWPLIYTSLNFIISCFLQLSLIFGI